APSYQLISPSWLDLYSTCSKFGVSTLSDNYDIELPRLIRIISEIYSEENPEDLSWKLRDVTGKTINEKIDVLVRTNSPENIIREMIFDRPTHITRCFDVLRYGNFKKPESRTEEDYMIKKVLWKLGFDVREYPITQKRFWELLGILENTSKSYIKRSEDDKEVIRSAAVNFFVSMEEVLDRSLSFITWVLLSDHYRDTRGKYNYYDAKEFITQKLNGKNIGKDITLELDDKGKNTLYPLIIGFSVLANYSNELIKTNENEYRRSVSTTPGFINKNTLQIFPYEHEIYIFDIRESDRSSLLGLLNEISKKLESSGMCEIRNRLEHKREDFPSHEEISKVTNVIREVISEMEETGIFPLIFLNDGIEIDKYNRIIHKFKSYKDEEYKIPGPSRFEASSPDYSSGPRVIIPCIRIGDSAEPLWFIYQENSEFIEMWKHFPRKKSILSNV
ncbi:hypothetical protein ACFLXY_03615, partial [Chloroflexota bacterium]